VVSIGVIIAGIVSVGWQAVAGSEADVGQRRARFLGAAVWGAPSGWSLSRCWRSGSVGTRK
jgi:hypothetical protein